MCLSVMGIAPIFRTDKGAGAANRQSEATDPTVYTAGSLCPARSRASRRARLPARAASQKKSATRGRGYRKEEELYAQLGGMVSSRGAERDQAVFPHDAPILKHAGSLTRHYAA
jgi:hypothetical protein